MQTQTSNTLHNAIMEAGSKDRLLMLAPGNYVQWKSRIKRYIDTKPNHELIHYCLENPPYKLDWKDIKVPVSKGSLVTTTARIHETYKNVSQEIRDQLNAKAEAVQIILTGIDNDIYSTVDACPNACEMWKAIERLKQGELINVQDLETNLYWEFGKFTSHDGESLESYYSRYASINTRPGIGTSYTKTSINLIIKQPQINWTPGGLVMARFVWPNQQQPIIEGEFHAVQHSRILTDPSPNLRTLKLMGIKIHLFAYNGIFENLIHLVYAQQMLSPAAVR
nr:hypothetical protein [Tanacetum cinerariifolium]